MVRVATVNEEVVMQSRLSRDSEVECCRAYKLCEQFKSEMCAARAFPWVERLPRFPVAGCLCSTWTVEVNPDGDYRRSAHIIVLGCYCIFNGLRAVFKVHNFCYWHLRRGRCKSICIWNSAWWWSRGRLHGKFWRWISLVLKLSSKFRK